MPTVEDVLRKPTVAIIATLMLASLGLTACGGSSGSSSSRSNAAATGAASSSTSTTASSHPGGPYTSAPPRFAAIRECLRKNGIALPKRTFGPNDRAPRRSFRAGGSVGGPLLPKGVTRTQFEAALKKCGGHDFGRRFGAPNGPGFRATNSPGLREGLAKFAACLRHNGINVPAPNTSGKGPIFSTKGIDTGSPKFRQATTKCRSALVGTLHRQHGANSG
jgi:hypothetical protein